MADIFFFQAEDGIRDLTVTGVQTCALPISKAGADVCITSRKADAGERARELVLKRFGGTVRAIAMPDATEAIRACERAELILNAGPAGGGRLPEQARGRRARGPGISGADAGPPP